MYKLLLDMRVPNDNQNTRECDIIRYVGLTQRDMISAQHCSNGLQDHTGCFLTLDS